MFVPRKNPPNHPQLPATRPQAVLLRCVAVGGQDMVSAQAQSNLAERKKKKRIGAGLPLSTSKSVRLGLSGPTQHNGFFIRDA